jgi:hypothetical protein
MVQGHVFEDSRGVIIFYSIRKRQSTKQNNNKNEQKKEDGESEKMI